MCVQGSHSPQGPSCGWRVGGLRAIRLSASSAASRGRLPGKRDMNRAAQRLDDGRYSGVGGRRLSSRVRAHAHEGVVCGVRQTARVTRGTGPISPPKGWPGRALGYASVPVAKRLAAVASRWQQRIEAPGDRLIRGRVLRWFGAGSASRARARAHALWSVCCVHGGELKAILLPSGDQLASGWQTGNRREPGRRGRVVQWPSAARSSPGRSRVRGGAFESPRCRRGSRAPTSPEKQAPERL